MNLTNNRIKKIMLKQGMTQEDLAKIIGISQGDLSEIIAGKKERLTLMKAAKISIALGFSMEYLWPGLFE